MTEQGNFAVIAVDGYAVRAIIGRERRYPVDDGDIYTVAVAGFPFLSKRRYGLTSALEEAIVFCARWGVAEQDIDMRQLPEMDRKLLPAMLERARVILVEEALANLQEA